MSKRRSLLLVDDDNLVLATTSRGLQAAGYDTRTAQSVEDALELLADFTPDLALLDIRMGKQGGFELARVLRDRHAIPFVFLSAYDDADTVEEATELGAVGFLVKPVDIPQIAPTIEAALKPGQTVLLLAGHGHVRRQLGVGNWLPAHLQLRLAIAQTEKVNPAIQGEADAFVVTPPVASKDHCADLRQQWKR